ncbi:TAXI family TRAP transporter solute-binding subunit [Amphritea pacifica]|uniref:TAXI family TRAP transporter solute-binding subunit n=1 Tax=Amphritea pacifica TaxID=2811233 RepID=A0ABS2W8S3_9GAMM|nr:TAXI family TRAP transporter solute-binding subunit [Amphritea pacifica]MBN0988126.1 TAXI family TRAP transporter solute-binding subunit [Amphritea pacifica]MBN1007569.1 TAXI family TRAP transporter solute-binding subunit [Amphritea pacifica]
MAFRNTITSLVIALGACVASVGAFAGDPVPVKEVVTIGTGGVTGVYYPTGGAICRLVNKSRSEHGIRCSTESTAGSGANLELLASRDINFGIAQSDSLYQAYTGSDKFAKAGPDKDLRVVFSLHSEPFTVVARADSGIKTIADIKGKKVNMGVPGTGQRGTLEALMKALGWTKADFALAAELNASAQASALCAGDIDVMIYMIGHPSGAIKEATTSCDSVLVDVTGPAVDKLVADNSYYQHATIPGGLYRGNDQETKSFGVESILVSSTDTSEEVVHQVVKEVFENFDIFRKLHPAFANLKKEDMLQTTGDIPFHQGTIKYLQETGMMK